MTGLPFAILKKKKILNISNTKDSCFLFPQFVCWTFPGRIGSWNAGNDDSPNATDDAADEIMDRIVKSATQVPSQRAVPRERKRSRANRKSCE